MNYLQYQQSMINYLNTGPDQMFLQSSLILNNIKCKKTKRELYEIEFKMLSEAATRN
jgi:hypothetical protein